jgi:hypothetical protein
MASLPIKQTTHKIRGGYGSVSIAFQTRRGHIWDQAVPDAPDGTWRQMIAPLLTVKNNEWGGDILRTYRLLWQSNHTFLILRVDRTQTTHKLLSLTSVLPNSLPALSPKRLQGGNLEVGWFLSDSGNMNTKDPHILLRKNPALVPS